MGQLKEAQVLLEATQLETGPVGCDPGATGSVPSKLLPTLLDPWETLPCLVLQEVPKVGRQCGGHQALVPNKRLSSEPLPGLARLSMSRPGSL